MREQFISEICFICKLYRAHYTAVSQLNVWCVVQVGIFSCIYDLDDLQIMLINQKLNFFWKQSYKIIKRRETREGGRTAFGHSWADSSVWLTIGQASCCPATRRKEDRMRVDYKGVCVLVCVHVCVCVSGEGGGVAGVCLTFCACLHAWDLKSLCRCHLFWESPTFCGSLLMPLAAGRVDRLWMAIPAVQRRPAARSQTLSSPY